MVNKQKKDRIILLVFGLFLFLIVGNQIVSAGNEPYKIDLAPQIPPDFSNYTTKEVGTLDELTSTLSDSKLTNIIIELQNDLQLTKNISIQGDKAINLNNHTLSATAKGYLLIPAKSTTTHFKLYNGSTTGGPTTVSIGGNNNTNSAFFSVDYSINATVVFENVSYKSPEKGGSFFKGLASNVFTLGTVDVETYSTNIRAGNMTFLGDFNGIAFGSGYQNWWGSGEGGLNLSFAGYAQSYLNEANFGKQVMSQTNGDRRIYIGPDAHVDLKNLNDYAGTNLGLSVANNIANFATIDIDGSLVAHAVGTSLRTTASNTNNGREYKNQAGTYNGQANINVNEGAIFEVSSTDTSAKFGTLYTFNTDLYSYKPFSFDLRYFGTGNFFYSYDTKPYSNLNLYDMNIGVWEKAAKGIGDPILSWANVESLKIDGFYNGIGGSNPYKGKIVSSTVGLADVFDVNTYSRISNDIDIPKTLVDSQYINKDNEVFLNNGGSTFSGSSAYTDPNEVVPNKVAVGATVTLKVDDQIYTTTTDESGKWTFNDLDLSKVAGGTVATLNLTDDDQRTAPEINVTIKDTIPPVATPKLIKVVLGDTSALQNAEEGIASASDETSPEKNLTYEFLTSEESRKQMINKTGFYTVDIKVSDEAGNSTIVTSPVIVYPPGEEPTGGFVTGNDFTIDYDTWNKASDDERRTLIIEEGNVKGYEIDENIVTEVTDDPTKMKIDLATATWEPNQTYPVVVSVNGYQKTINVTLLPSTVKMTIKQVYQGTDNPIYCDLEDKTPVDNTHSIDVTVGDTILTVLNNQVSNGMFTLNYDGYNTQTVSNYKIYQNGTEVTPTPTKVPDDAFTLVYEYQGQLKFQEVAKKLDFGSIEITGNNSNTPLSNTSETEISIVNTLIGATWKLKAAMPDGFTTTTNNQSFYGMVTYMSSSGMQTVIGTSPTEIEEQSDDSLYSQLDLKSNNSGLFLHQDSGNLKGSYTGTMIWTLEDAP